MIFYDNPDIADNGRIAVEKVKNNQYDLIFMDIQMPEIHSYEATRVIGVISNDLTNSIPIVVLTPPSSTTKSRKMYQSRNEFLHRKTIQSAEAAAGDSELNEH